MATKSVGGQSEVKQATPEVQKICDQVKHNAEEKAGRQFTTFKATAFTTLFWDRSYYYIKVNVGGDEFVHIRVYKFVLHTRWELQGIQMPKTQQDPILYF